MKPEYKRILWISLVVVVLVLLVSTLVKADTPPPNTVKAKVFTGDGAMMIAGTDNALNVFVTNPGGMCSSDATKLQGVDISSVAPTDGQCLIYTSSGAHWIPGSCGGGGLGTVTSVGLSLPNIFTVSGTPVTTSGTLTGTLASQSMNRVFAAPNGSSGAPSFRVLVAADIPALGYSTIALDNLSAVAINASLVPGADNSINIGSGSKQWANVFAGTTFNLGNGKVFESLSQSVNFWHTTLPGLFVNSEVYNDLSKGFSFGSSDTTVGATSTTPLSLQTGDNLATGGGTAQTGDIYVNTGAQATAGATGGTGGLFMGTGNIVSGGGGGNSGEVTLTTGAVQSGTSGQVFIGSGGVFGGGSRGIVEIDGASIQMDDQVNMSSNKIVNLTDPTSAQDAATKNYVDTHGGGGGATTSLNNLASVAVNVEIAPGVDNSIPLGDSSHRWSDVEFINAHMGGTFFSNVGVDLAMKTQNNAGGTDPIRLTTGDASGGDTGQVVVTTGTAGGGHTQGNIVLRGRNVDFNGTVATNIASPSGSSDAVTKGYGDSHYATASASFIPTSDNTFDLGSTSSKWANGYVGNVFSNQYTSMLGSDNTVTTQNNGSGATDTIRITTGNAVGGSSGQIVLTTGTGSTQGNIVLRGLNTDFNNSPIQNASAVKVAGTTSPKILISPSVLNQGFGSNRPAVIVDSDQLPGSDLIFASTDTSSATNGSAGVAMFSGQTTDAAQSTGDVNIFSGNVNSVGGTGSSGAVNIETGLGQSGPSGAINLNVGDVNIGNSGGIDLSSGVTVTSGNTGDITIHTGLVLGTGTRGNVILTGGAVQANSHLKSVTTAPGAAPTANAGTGASCSVANATDTAGSISLTTTGVASSSGVVCEVTFNKAYGVAPICVFAPKSANAIVDAVIQGVFFTTSTTKLSVNFANTDAIGRTYAWTYYCIETQ